MTGNILILAYEAMPGSGTEAGLAEKWARIYSGQGYKVTILSSGPTDSPDQLNMWDPCISKVIRIGKNQHAKAAQKPHELIKNAIHYRNWTSQVRSFLKANSNWHIIHHVSWGSIRLAPAMTTVHPEAKTVWGPLGGGQLALFRGLPFRAWPQELLRAIAFPIAIARQRARFSGKTEPSLTLVTNDQTRKFADASGLDQVEMMFADGIDPAEIVDKGRTGAHDVVRLLWLGRMVHSKRPDISLLVLKNLLDRGVQASLVFAGDGPELVRLKQLSKRLQIDENVEFLGKVPWSQVIDLYDSSDYLVFTSMRDSSSPSVLEAAGRGLPSLVLRHQGVGSMVPEIVARGPRVWRGAQNLAMSLVDDVLAHRDDPQGYVHASNEAIAWARSQTWDNKVSYVLDYLGEEITDGQGRQPSNTL
ncbi:glycosyltransferase family 4 protein [Arthrobacter sp. ERGS1:01]|uniref:glycosyltransferase family 4 protein n=1 Tax=Arthrobacter sp. ERGS1:01 TaxID=1704044 RepID=UPI000B28ABB0|nr:glycosyltransferase [Arthrobacter sp. ERGS1:01]